MLTCMRAEVDAAPLWQVCYFLVGHSFSNNVLNISFMGSDQFFVEGSSVGTSSNTEQPPLSIITTVALFAETSFIFLRFV